MGQSIAIFKPMLNCFSRQISCNSVIRIKMKAIIIATLVAFAAARPNYGYGNGRPDTRDSSIEIIEILRDDRNGPEDGRYTFNFESANGISRSESGAPIDIDGNPTGQQGHVSFTLPNGEDFELRFVADENGFQPESSHLPVAPEFPHPIPDFVLEQIEKAAREDAEAARSGRSEVSAPSRGYSYNK